MEEQKLSIFPEWEQEFAIPQRTFHTTSTIPLGASNHRKQKLRIENEHLLNGIEREGFLGMPKALPVYMERVPDLFVPYCCRKSCQTTHACIHFYIDDYKFNAVWGRLEQTLKSLSKYDAVISTDDSVFLDLPLIDNMRNVFKNRVFTAVGQRMGLNVIPSFSCGNPVDIEFYCDGLPEGGCIAVSCMGTDSTRSQQLMLKYCVQEMCKRKHPDLLLVYGSKTDLGVSVPIVRIPTFVDNLRNR